jgi:hypothetical protein
MCFGQLIAHLKENYCINATPGLCHSCQAELMSTSVLAHSIMIPDCLCETVHILILYDDGVFTSGFLFHCFEMMKQESRQQQHMQ